MRTNHTAACRTRVGMAGCRGDKKSKRRTPTFKEIGETIVHLCSLEAGMGATKQTLRDRAWIISKTAPCNTMIVKLLP